MNDFKRIVLSNDDGMTPQILALADFLISKGHEVLVSVPNQNCSAYGSIVTLKRDLRCTISELKENTENTIRIAFSDGTPCDATMIGLTLAEVELGGVDLVISGPNAGSNAGIEINHSGTYHAAKIARLHHIPAMACSIDNLNINKSEISAELLEAYNNVIYTALLEYRDIVNDGTIEEKGAILTGVEHFLNVNLPNECNVNDLNSIRLVKAVHGTRRWTNTFVVKYVDENDVIVGYNAGELTECTHLETITDGMLKKSTEADGLYGRTYVGIEKTPSEDSLIRSGYASFTLSPIL